MARLCIYIDVEQRAITIDLFTTQTLTHTTRHNIDTNLNLLPLGIQFTKIRKMIGLHIDRSRQNSPVNLLINTEQLIINDLDSNEVSGCVCGGGGGGDGGDGGGGDGGGNGDGGNGGRIRNYVVIPPIV